MQPNQVFPFFPFGTNRGGGFPFTLPGSDINLPQQQDGNANANQVFIPYPFFGFTAQRNPDGNPSVGRLLTLQDLQAVQVQALSNQAANTITSARDFKCPTCGRSFSRRGNFTRHLKLHTGVKPFACPECGKKFASKGNLKTHTAVHAKPPRVFCEYCSRSYRRQGFLEKHVEQHERQGHQKQEKYITIAKRSWDKFIESKRNALKAEEFEGPQLQSQGLLSTQASVVEKAEDVKPTSQLSSSMPNDALSMPNDARSLPNSVRPPMTEIVAPAVPDMSRLTSPAPEVREGKSSKDGNEERETSPIPEDECADDNVPGSVKEE